MVDFKVRKDGRGGSLVRPVSPEAQRVFRDLGFITTLKLGGWYPFCDRPFRDGSAIRRRMAIISHEEV